MSDSTKILINRENFFQLARLAGLFGKITQTQVDTIDAIFNEWERRQLADKRWLSYMLATVYHETAMTMRPVEEYGKGKGYDYGKKLKRSRIPYSLPDKLYYGRGLVQITWFENYASFGKILGLDLLNKPELACQADVAVKIMFIGMINGDFTGRALGHFFSPTNEDWVNAREIINGEDCADKIARNAKLFFNCLK
jgi:putative chitinase